MVVIVLKTYTSIALLLFLLAWGLLWKEHLSIKQLVGLALCLCVWPLLFPLFVWTWIERSRLALLRRRLRKQGI